MAKSRITKEFLVNELSSFVEKNGRTPTRREFGYVSPIRKHFGTFNAFVSSQGYDLNNPGHRALTRNHLVSKLETFIDTHNRIPTRREFGHELQVRNLFGTFNKFIESSGYEPNSSAAVAESLIRKRFGRLVVISKSDKMINRQTTWNCLCDCGNSKNDIPRGLLTSGQTKSCGCLHQESFENLEKRKEFQVEGTSLKLLSDKPFKNNKTGVRGVFFSNRRQKYVAVIEFQGERHHLGYFDKLSDATTARKEAEEKYFDPILKKYNFPKD
ncbi:hypothetical protein GUI59_19235 [Enterococcus raffinosus]|uniref:homing endonuclease associated repeat-containing protein n=1 Tax=Enterococcus raffinosus TaxID=71452 RepID=UPI001368314A|nr:hypothetical protein [Enterococcus raffinosus]MZZ66983.1 hypothetical protein [Enterococcus raffinosus]